MLNKLLSYLKSVQWNHEGTGHFLGWFLCLVVLAVFLLTSVVDFAIRWLRA